MIAEADFVNRNTSENETSISVLSSQRCYFYDPLNNYELGGFLYIESIVTTVINFIGAVIATLGNGIILVTFWKTNQLRSQSQLFLWCLAFADFLTGFIAQPFYGAFKIAYLAGYVSACCVLRAILETVAWFSAALSCSLVSSIIGERYLALHYHMRYHDVVTTKRTILYIVFLVIVMGIASQVSRFAMTNMRPFLYLSICALLLSHLTLLTCSWKIYKQVRRHLRQIKDQSSAESQSLDMQRHKKSVMNMAYIAFLYIISFLPFTCVLGAYLSNGFTSTVEAAYDITRTMAFMSSSWNPFIYFWKIQELKDAVQKVMKKDHATVH